VKIGRISFGTGIQQTALISKNMATNLKQLQTRLNKGSLTASDVKELNALIANALGSSKGRKTLGGRPIIASLPGGLDVVK
jgi:hypothetical protein